MTYSFHVPDDKNAIDFFQKNPLKFNQNYPWKQRFKVIEIMS